MVFEHGWDWTVWKSQSCNLETLCSPVRCDQKCDFLGQELPEGSHTSAHWGQDSGTLNNDSSWFHWEKLWALQGSVYILDWRVNGLFVWYNLSSLPCLKPSGSIPVVLKDCPRETGFLPFLGNDLLVSLLPLVGLWGIPLLLLHCDSQLVFSLLWHAGSSVCSGFFLSLHGLCAPPENLWKRTCLFHLRQCRKVEVEHAKDKAQCDYCVYARQTSKLVRQSWAILPCEVNPFALHFIKEMVWKSGSMIVGEISARSQKHGLFSPLRSEVECSNCPFPLVCVVSFHSYHTPKVWENINVLVEKCV